MAKKRGLWIPMEIMMDKRLTNTEKIVISVLISLDGGQGCFATNNYLAEFCTIRPETVSRVISKAKKLGLLDVSSLDNKSRKVDILSRAPCENIKGTLTNNQCNPPSNHILYYNTDYNTGETAHTPASPGDTIPPTVDMVRGYVQEMGYTVNPQRFIDYYTAQGWTVRGSPVRDWKALVRCWQGSEKNRTIKSQKELDKDRAYVEDVDEEWLEIWNR